jgi:uncharacterized membrane protein YdjX (TVP38/TMEM64 family)
MLFAALATVAIVAALLPVGDYAWQLLEWIARRGPWSPVLLIVAYVLACVLALPAWPLTLGAGFLFGLLWGTVIVSFAATTGATAAFLVARYAGRGSLVERFARHHALQAFDRALSEQAFKIVLLLRLSPAVPFNVLNYALGLSTIPPATFVLASWLGMLPGTLMYVYLGTAARSLRELVAGEAQASPVRYIWLILGVLATLAVTVVLTRIARQAIRQTLRDESSTRAAIR